MVRSGWYVTSIAGIARAERGRSLFVHRVRLAILSTLHEAHIYLFEAHIYRLQLHYCIKPLSLRRILRLSSFTQRQYTRNTEFPVKKRSTVGRHVVDGPKCRLSARFCYAALTLWIYADGDAYSIYSQATALSPNHCRLLVSDNIYPEIRLENVDNHRRSQGCSGCTCTPRGRRKNLGVILQGKFVNAPPAHQVHPQAEQESILGHFLLGVGDLEVGRESGSFSSF